MNQQNNPLPPRNPSSPRGGCVPQTVSGTSRPRFQDVKIRHNRNLPHWEIDNGIYFVTFRLADSLPSFIFNQYKSELKANQNASSANKQQLNAMYSERIDNYLDSSHGKCHLANQQIAEVTANAIQFFDGERYKIFAWCVMPNHVHVVMQPFEKYELASIMQSWKSFTAKKANKILGRTGTFWQREYYDHIVRDEDDLLRVIKYVIDNPVKANLIDWKWVGIDERFGGLLD